MRKIISNYGITLMAVSVSVAVIIILGITTITSLNKDTSILNKIKTKEFRSEVTMYKEDLSVYIKEEKLKDDFDLSLITAGSINGLTDNLVPIIFTKNVNEILPDFLEKYSNRLFIYNGRLYYLEISGQDNLDNELNVCNMLGIPVWQNS